MAVGLSLIGAGIALAQRSATGTSPISCLPAVVYSVTQAWGIQTFTLGMFTFTLNILLFIAEIILLRKRFKPVQFLQIPALIVMTASIDLWSIPIGNIPIPNYAIQIICLAASILVLGLGVFLEVKANVLIAPSEAIVYVIASVSGKPFRFCKVAFNVTLMVIASATSLIILGGFHGVREGTVLSAILTGIVVGMWTNALTFIDSLIPASPKRFIAPVVDDSTQL